MRVRLFYTLLWLCLGQLFFSCQKNAYYKDSGTPVPQFNGTIMQYLKSHPEYYDSLVKIIQRVGYEQVLDKPNTTFFAPADSSIRAAMRQASDFRERVGKSRITQMDQISPAIWRKHLGKYIFEFSRGLNDFSQVDFLNITSYPGQMYSAYSKQQMNIGAVFTDLVNTNPETKIKTTIKYGGYRYLAISYLSSPFSPSELPTWRRATVSSVNIKPTNGYIHLLRFTDHVYGFDADEFAQDAAYYNH